MDDQDMAVGIEKEEKENVSHSRTLWGAFKNGNLVFHNTSSPSKVCLGEIKG